MIKHYGLLSLLFCCFFLRGEEASDKDFDLERLMNMTVSSVTASELKLKETPAAVYILTSEDIKNAGFQSIPEALRMVPGMQVSQANSNSWSISSRGFNRLYSNKLLVMIDGRALSTALFTGVFWESQDLLIEDIDRIEVVRGPGAVLWGAGAVNGVVNIITKRAEDSQGTYLKFLGGSHYKAITAIQHGDKINDDAFYKLSLKYRDVESSVNNVGESSPDDWNFYKGDLRFDWDISKFTELSFISGVGYSDHIGTSISRLDLRPTPLGSLAHPTTIQEGIARVRNYYFLLNMKHEFSLSHRIHIGGFFDSAKRVHPIDTDRREVLDLNFKDFYLNENKSQFVWGLGFRAKRDNAPDAPEISISPQSTVYTKASGLMEYTHHLIDDELILVLGSKFEVNDYTGFEIQPSARLSYHLNDKHLIWTSASRAVRNPARYEDSSRLMSSQSSPLIPAPFNAALLLRGNSKVKSEVLYAYELGFRSEWSEGLDTDIALFYNKYSDLITSVVDPASEADMTTPTILDFKNAGSADTFGVETSVHWQPCERFNLTASYTFLRSNESGTGEESLEESAPQHAVNIQSHYQLTKSLAAHANGYYKDNVGRTNVEQCMRLDLGLSYEVKKDVELSLWGQNLLTSSHSETRDELFGGERSFIERSFYVQLTAKF